jgi:hypothetical protein
MLRSTQHKHNAQGELIPPSSKLDAIDACLKDMSRTWPMKELTPEEINHWHLDLGVFPLLAINWAFDSWRRNGRFFPVFGDILDLCVAWEPKVSGHAICNVECKRRHYRGYGETDMIKLWKLYGDKHQNRLTPLTDAEWEALYDDLDKWRGKAPEWRETA